MNQSDTPIVGVEFAPKSGNYTDYSGWDGKDFPTIKAKKPAPVAIEIYLEPGDAQDVRFQTCTRTSEPKGSYDFSVVPPDFVAFTWETGQRDEACFKC